MTGDAIRPGVAGLSGVALPPISNWLYVFGAVSLMELNSWIETAEDPPEVKEGIRNRWLEAAERFRGRAAEVAGVGEAGGSGLQTSEAVRVMDSLRGDPRFQATFGRYAISFEEVRIDRLVACQRAVNLDFAAALPVPTSESGLLEFCLGVGEATRASEVRFARTGAGSMSFASLHPGLDVLGSASRAWDDTRIEEGVAGGLPVHSVEVVFGFPVATVNAYRVGERTILSNGFHRLFALRTAGITHAPVVIVNVRAPDVEIPANLAEVSRNYAINEPCPCTLGDFFDRRLTCMMRRRAPMKVLHFSWQVARALVPRI